MLQPKKKTYFLIDTLKLVCLRLTNALNWHVTCLIVEASRAKQTPTSKPCACIKVTKGWKSTNEQCIRLKKVHTKMLHHAS